VVAIVTDPQSGALYYIAWTAFIRKISFAPTTNVPPVAVATTDKSFGPSPLTVQLSAAGSSDGNGGTLTYSWDFGDGSSPQSGLTVSHTYTAAGVQSFTPTVTVRDPTNLTSTASVLVSVNNTPPTATITSPQDGTRYPLTGPTQYTLSATLGDTQSGGGALACSWTRILHHNTHTHNDPPDNHCQSTGTTTPLGCGDETY
jgi:PKD repeat protein